jgi:hypothetical protein
VNATTVDALLSIAEHLEWAERLSGCASRPGEAALLWRCCPTCYGVKPRHNFNDDPATAFPENQIGHRPECVLDDLLRQLRELR